MTKENRNSYLELEVIWKDEDLIELSVIASNMNFYGRTEVYDQSKGLSAFASTLKGFPNGNTI